MGEQIETDIKRKDQLFNVAFRAYFFVLAFGLVGSVVSRATSISPGIAAPVSSALLTLTAAICVAVELESPSRIVWLAGIATGAELLGVFTGFPFGRYAYTDKWWPTILVGSQHFPLLIPFAWILVAGGSLCVVRRWTSAWWSIPLAAALATLIDWPMERSMVDVFGYWSWNAGNVPLANALGWFGTSLVALAPFARQKPPRPTDRSGVVLGCFCIFLAVTGALRFWDMDWLALAGLGALLISSSLKKVKVPAVTRN